MATHGAVNQAIAATAAADTSSFTNTPEGAGSRDHGVRPALTVGRGRGRAQPPVR
jgi:hypothetical protein